jgi:hypothetical protein
MPLNVADLPSSAAQLSGKLGGGSLAGPVSKKTTAAPFTASQATSAVQTYKKKQDTTAFNSIVANYQYIFDEILSAANSGDTSLTITTTNFDYTYIAPLLVSYGYTVSELPSSTTSPSDITIKYDITISWPSTTPSPITSISPTSFIAIQNSPYSVTFTPQGGQAPYTFTLSGQLPSGWTNSTLNKVASLTIQGTSTTLGGGSLIISVVDSLSQSYTTTVNWTVTQPAQIQADWSAASGLGFILNKPTVYSSAYLGTTSVAFNRASAAQTLSDVSITGTAATADQLTNDINVNSRAFNGSSDLVVSELINNDESSVVSLGEITNGGIATVVLATPLRRSDNELYDNPGNIVITFAEPWIDGGYGRDNAQGTVTVVDGEITEINITHSGSKYARKTDVDPSDPLYNQILCKITILDNTLNNLDSQILQDKLDGVTMTLTAATSFINPTSLVWNNGQGASINGAYGVNANGIEIRASAENIHGPGDIHLVCNYSGNHNEITVNSGAIGLRSATSDGLGGGVSPQTGITMTPSVINVNGTVTMGGLVQFTGGTSGLTKSSVGLSNVTNESKTTMFTNSALTGTTTIATATITTGNITTANITTDNVTTANITTANITTDNITTGNITTANITTANITTDNITTAVITQGTLTTVNNTATSLVNKQYVDNRAFFALAVGIY